MSDQATALALALTDGSPFAIAFRDTVLALDALTAADMNSDTSNLQTVALLIKLAPPVRQLVDAVLAEVPSTSPTQVAMLSTTEAADWLGISVRMVHHYTRPTIGWLVPDRRIGRVMLFAPTTLARFHQKLRGPA